MRSTSFVSLALLSVGMVACGSDEDWGPKSQFDYPNDSFSSSSTTTLSGSVVSAFQITVDGKAYDDSEDFYTAEVQRLPEKVAAGGYGGWDAKFIAVLGFNDLAKDMRVYLSPIGNSGFTGQASVGYDSKFSIQLPSGAKDGVYNLRAVKRVNVVLSRGGESKTFCYNFSAVERNVMFSEIFRPVVLDNFVTKLTAYSCESAESGGGLNVPSAGSSLGIGTLPQAKAPDGGGGAPATSIVIATVSLGDSPESVVAKFGDPQYISRPSSYLYSAPSYDLAWDYRSFPGSTSTHSCTLRFKAQRLVGYDACPASRIRFLDDSTQVADKPTQRVALRDSDSVVLQKWGLPARISRSDNGNELTWEYTQSLLTSSSCTLKFSAGSVVSHSLACTLSFLAHWSF